MFIVKTVTCLLFLLVVSATSFAQFIKRIDGSSITADSLTAQIAYLMKAANVSGVAIFCFQHQQAGL